MDVGSAFTYMFDDESWIGKILFRGDFGRSFRFRKPVSEIIGERIPLTVMISLLTIIFTWVMAIPIGIYSATRQYSFFDYFFTFIGFLGVRIPGAYLLAWDEIGLPLGDWAIPGFGLGVIGAWYAMVADVVVRSVLVVVRFWHGGWKRIAV